jgi:superfamily II DNA or RNA helicase
MDDEGKQKMYELRQRKGQDLDGAELLNLERKLVIENRARFKYVCDLIGKTTKNALVLFLDVKYGYGKKIYHYIRENVDNKVAYYVDGSTPADIREEYKAGMETGDNRVLVASFGTFSTGISINNIHHIFFVESYKSDRLVRQSIGRGMRLKDGKDKVYLWDFVDDFRYGTDNRYKNNYLYRHGKARIKTYNEQGFPNKTYRVKL